eukprot:s726_g15.t1
MSGLPGSILQLDLPDDLKLDDVAAEVPVADDDVPDKEKEDKPKKSDKKQKKKEKVKKDKKGKKRKRQDEDEDEDSLSDKDDEEPTGSRSDKKKAQPARGRGRGEGRGRGGGRKFTSDKKEEENAKKHAAALERVEKELAHFISLGVQSPQQREDARQRSIQAKRDTWRQIKLVVVCLVVLVKTLRLDLFYCFVGQ